MVETPTPSPLKLLMAALISATSPGMKDYFLFTILDRTKELGESSFRKFHLAFSAMIAPS